MITGLEENLAQKLVCVFTHKHSDSEEMVFLLQLGMTQHIFPPHTTTDIHSAMPHGSKKNENAQFPCTFLIFAQNEGEILFSKHDKCFESAGEKWLCI